MLLSTQATDKDEQTEVKVKKHNAEENENVTGAESGNTCRTCAEPRKRVNRELTNLL